MTLAEYITQHMHTPFKWGEHDCVLFAAGWVREATRFDHLSDLPRWSNEREALRILRDHGGLEAMLDERFDRVHPNLACDGALTIHKNSVCIFSGAHIVGPGIGGLQFVKRTEAMCAWHY